MIDQKWFYYHDLFNLVNLPLVVLTNVLYLLDTSSERFYYLQQFLFNAYLIADTIWLLLKPDSVASASSVLPHHVICIIGWNVPLLDKLLAFYRGLPQPSPEYARFTCSGALVEINTFLLIARRNWRSNNLIEFLFYFSWFAIRCLFYPYNLLFKLYPDYFRLAYYQKSYINVQFFIVLMFTPLNVLNLRWTIDLVKRNFYGKIQKSKNYSL